MTRPQQLTALSDKNLADIQPVYTAKGLDDATKMIYISDFDYMDKYLDVLNTVGSGYPEIVERVSEIVHELVENHPEAALAQVSLLRRKSD